MKKVALIVPVLMILYLLSNYFSIPLEVYNYEIQIQDLSKVNNIITVYFGVTPQIGAHNPVRYNEVTFSVDNN